MNDRQAYFHELQQTANLAECLSGALSACFGRPERENLGFVLVGEIYTLVKELQLGLDSTNLPEEDA
ncbi:hypothetical protein [Tabrizicola sp.]|uniref:hypothetical protein n=1 Tax=Tabrizicola sp. TaxID=2005166 RepID=UPI001A60F2A5|nr:hypothetical protein [Tabrizicola sp.]MBL9075743.1 hypothetical protein [Tabrizicola sp.]